MATTPANLISVIVPIYNVRDYVGACISSLRAQSYTNFEVVLVDDGSTDGSADHALAAVDDDPRFRIVSQAHAGLSAARNRGLDDAQGRFVAFVDSDDCVAPAYLSTLLSTLLNAPECPWVACAIRNRYPDGNYTVHSTIFDSPEPTLAPGCQLFTFRSALDVIRHYPSAWNKLYRRDFIGDLRFREGVWFEDHAFYLTLALRAGSMLHLDVPLYEQTRGRVGQITETESDRIFQQLDVLEEILPLLQNAPLPEGNAAAAELASRLLSERSCMIRSPSRRLAFLQRSNALLSAHGISYLPNTEMGALTSLAIELHGILPLSVIVPWDGGDTDLLAETLTSIARQRGPGFELLIPTTSRVHIAQGLVSNILPEFGPDHASVFDTKHNTLGGTLQAGLNRAEGQLVVFVQAGDLLEMDALQTRTEALLTQNAQVGLSARCYDPGLSHETPFPSAGFSDEFVPAHLDRPTSFVPTPLQALDADLAVSAAIFDRTFLNTHGLRPAATRRYGGWPLLLGALLLCDTAVYLPAMDVKINATARERGAKARGYSAAQLNHDHKQLCETLPASAVDVLPIGWERRLLARALRSWLVDGPERGRLSRLAALASAAGVIAIRGMGRADQFNPAGFDPQVGPKFSRLFDTKGLFRLLRSSERSREISHFWKINPRDLNPDQRLHLFDVRGSSKAPSQLRASIHFDASRLASLTFFTHSGQTIAFHLTLDQANNLIRCNDTRSDGVWREERTRSFEISPAGCALRLDIAPGSSRNAIGIWIDDTLVWTLPSRSLARRAGFTRLEEISHVYLGPGATLLDLRPDAVRTGLALDGRLKLHLCGPVPAQSAITVEGVDAAALDDLIIGPKGECGSIALPARLWLDVPVDSSIALRFTRPDEPDQNLTLSRDELAQRINALLETGLPVSDTELVLHVIETVAFAGIASQLKPAAQTDLARLAQFFGVSSLLPELIVAPRYYSDPLTVETTNLARDIASAGPGVPSFERLLPADPNVARHMVLKLVEWAIDRNCVQQLYSAAKTAGALPHPLPDNDLWALSASLPLLWLDRREAELLKVLSQLPEPLEGWRVTPAMAWVGTAALMPSRSVSEATRMQTVSLLLDWLEAEAKNYWGRTACAQMIRWGAALVGHLDRMGSDLARRGARVLTAVYGATPQFWSHIPEDTVLPAPLTLARVAFQQLQSASDPDTCGRALDHFQKLGLIDIDRVRIEYLGPASVPVASDISLTPLDLLPVMQLGSIGENALRHMAFPGTGSVDPATARLVSDTIGDMVHEQTKPPYLPLQQIVHARISVFLAEPSAENLASILSDLAVLSCAAANYLGLGLAMTLLPELESDNQRKRVADWLLTYHANSSNDTTLYSKPAVRMGLTRLSAQADIHSRTVLAHFTGAPDSKPLPKLPAPNNQLPAPHPLNDVIVTVFSCRPYLDVRIPELRAGWLADLDAMGIPYVIVVGNGDNSLCGDVLYLDAADDYEGLPAKTLATLEWVRRNTTYSHIFKIDDDCFVDAPALFGSLSWRGVDYMGRRLHRVAGQTDRIWHQKKASSRHGKLELDKSAEPSTYADGGSGYILSRDAMEAACAAARTSNGRALIRSSFLEDKLLGDLLALGGISLSTPGYLTSRRMRTFADATPVAYWNSGFYPSLASPTQQVHMDTHLHQPELRALRNQAVLEPRKIWPSFQRPRLGYQSNALELISAPRTVESARSAQVAVVAVVRNEAFMLPAFLAHYRRLGVQSFLVTDNVSDDGSREYLLEQDDVALFSADTSYNQSHYGVAWQQAMLHAFRKDRWTIVADADELLVWQKNQTQTLPELLGGPTFEQADAARIFMLDMYPKGPIDTATFTTGTPFEQAGYADREPFTINPLARGPYSDQTVFTSALRHRLIPRSRHDLFTAQKIAMLRYKPHMRLSDGLHSVTGAKIATQDLIFGHFKYNADFYRKARVEVARKQHYNDAEEYRKYLALASEGRAQIYDADLSLPWYDVPFVKSRLT